MSSERAVQTTRKLRTRKASPAIKPLVKSKRVRKQIKQQLKWRSCEQPHTKQADGVAFLSLQSQAEQVDFDDSKWHPVDPLFRRRHSTGTVRTQRHNPYASLLDSFQYSPANSRSPSTRGLHLSESDQLPLTSTSTLPQVTQRETFSLQNPDLYDLHREREGILSGQSELMEHSPYFLSSRRVQPEGPFTTHGSPVSSSLLAPFTEQNIALPIDFSGQCSSTVGPSRSIAGKYPTFLVPLSQSQQFHDSVLPGKLPSARPRENLTAMATKISQGCGLTMGSFSSERPAWHPSQEQEQEQEERQKERWDEFLFRPYLSSPAPPVTWENHQQRSAANLPQRRASPNLTTATMTAPTTVVEHHRRLSHPSTKIETLSFQNDNSLKDDSDSALTFSVSSSGPTMQPSSEQHCRSQRRQSLLTGDASSPRRKNASNVPISHQEFFAPDETSQLLPLSPKLWDYCPSTDVSHSAFPPKVAVTAIMPSAIVEDNQGAGKEYPGNSKPDCCAPVIFSAEKREMTSHTEIDTLPPGRVPWSRFCSSFPSVLPLSPLPPFPVSVESAHQLNEKGDVQEGFETIQKSKMVLQDSVSACLISRPIFTAIQK